MKMSNQSQKHSIKNSDFEFLDFNHTNLVSFLFLNYAFSNQYLKTGSRDIV